MKFVPPVPYTYNKSENILMDALKEAFAYDKNSVTYSGLQPRKKNGSLDKESDLTVLHPDLGLLVIECKGCKIDSIEMIRGDIWHMKQGWYKNTIQPFQQAKAAMFTIANVIQRFCKTELTCNSYTTITNSSLVALPLISEREWQAKYRSLNIRSGLILKDDLEPAKLKQKLIDSRPQRRKELTFSGTSQQWCRIIDFCSTDSMKSQIARGIKPEQSSPSTLKRAIQGEYFDFDDTQVKIATSIPEGPQRLRGLAGTGKTLLLAKRAANIHFQHPEWNVAFVSYSNSLQRQISELIQISYKELLNHNNLPITEPNWDKLNVMSAWKGFYCNLVKKSNYKSQVISEQTLIPIEKRFNYLCDRFERGVVSIPQIFDAIVIDEGQDLPCSFYRLALKSLTEPKRLYWAYDEAQGLNSLIIPDASSVFGRDEDSGKPLVNLFGRYSKEDGGTNKSIILNSCYRTPRQLLMVAHAINMGLFHHNGVIQAPSTKANWQSLGYEVTEGDFSNKSVKENKIVTITRPDSKSPHAVDIEELDLQSIGDSLIEHKIFNCPQLEGEWVAQEAYKDINHRGFEPDDILITGIFEKHSRNYFQALKRSLNNLGVQTYIAGSEQDKTIFRKPGYVTIANVYQAKGNEAWKVYVNSFHAGYREQNAHDIETIIRKRNEAFTAISRSKLQCVITGQPSPIFDELKIALSQGIKFSFPAYNKTSRSLDDEASIDIEPPQVMEQLTVDSKVDQIRLPQASSSRSSRKRHKTKKNHKSRPKLRQNSDKKSNSNCTKKNLKRATPKKSPKLQNKPEKKAILSI